MHKSTALKTIPLMIAMTLIMMPALLPAVPVMAEEAAQTKEAKDQQEQTLDQENNETLETLTRLLSEQKQQNQLIKELKNKLRAAKENVTKTELEEQLKAETVKLENIENQIASLTSGITDEAYFANQTKTFNLEEELQNLAEPIVKMIKSSTEDARFIDKLKTTITESQRRQLVAKEALERIDVLMDTKKNKTTNNTKLAKTHLKKQRAEWAKRLEEATNLETTTRKQLQLKEKSNKTLNLNNYATDFIRTRGLNLLIAVFTFFATLIILRLIDKSAAILFRKSGLKKSLYARAAKISFEFFTIIAALLTTMIVLNLMNDWVLLAIAGLFTLALVWISLKVLPAIIEQTVLLLNLGAVQEGERLMIDGVPWRVKTLDHYTDFENPALEGGHFTLPIRELIGRHSRPPAAHEAWFPTQKGDWIQLENGQIAKVNSQTPELVQLIELGGSRITFTTQDFLAAKFRNLSTGFRIRQEFGLAYAHQKDAAEKIPNDLKTFILKGLEQYIPPEDINHVAVGLVRAGASSLDFDIEVDIKGRQAENFEEIEGEITRLIIMASNEMNLELPFPQLVIHNQQG